MVRVVRGKELGLMVLEASLRILTASQSNHWFSRVRWRISTRLLTLFPCSICWSLCLPSPPASVASTKDNLGGILENLLYDLQVARS